MIYKLNSGSPYLLSNFDCRQVSQLAQGLQLHNQATLRDRIEAVNQRLFVEEGFKGNQRDYYDPHNSFLHSVLSRR